VDIRGARLPVEGGIVGRAVRDGAVQLVRDVALDPNFERAVDEQSGFTTRSILCAPLVVRGERLGAIELVNKRGADERFAPRDARVLMALAASAALAIQNARMAERLVEEERVRRELELAAEIQRSLLPARRPPGFPVCGRNVAARVVSGDFYDFFAVGPSRIAFCAGDVSGKGMDAALLMAKTASLVRCLGKAEPSPGRLLAAVNREICETQSRGRFVTLVAAALDLDTGRVRLANAGHEPPLLLHPDGRVEAVAAEAPPLGITLDLGPGGEVPESELVLGAGALYVFTDGLTEDIQPDGTLLGVEGLVRLLRAEASRPLGERIDRVVERLASDGHRDDLTLLGVELAGGAPG
jgi:sigma-B regulation protein RsbU (phosphoserine phosphatase)